MDETTLDERGRTWAFTALALGTAALVGGGTFAIGLQMLVMGNYTNNGFGSSFAVTVAATPLLMGGVALWLASTAVRSADSLARSVGRAAQALSGLAILGAVLVMVAARTVGG